MIEEICKKARSYRSFDRSVKIDRETLNYALNCARISPNARNIQPLKYKIVEGDRETKEFTKLLKFAAKLDIKLPPEGKEPTTAIVICHDTDVCPFAQINMVDVGISAEAITLALSEKGYGSCIVGSFDAKEVAEHLKIGDNLLPKLVIVAGKPCERVEIEESDINVDYYRDENNTHFVRKRKLEDITVK